MQTGGQGHHYLLKHHAGAERAVVSLEELSHWANAQLQSPGFTERAFKGSLQQADAETARTICAEHS